MTRRNNPAHRCAACGMHSALCVCGATAPIVTRTRVVVITHYIDARKPSNTGRLAVACLSNARLVVWGRRPDAPDAPGAPDAELGPLEGEPLVLFPHASARPVAELAGEAGPFTLIVPDGSWRQAGKMRERVPGLRGAQRVALPLAEPSAYRLREGPHAHALATIEAIARALEVLEGTRGPEVRAALEGALRVVVERTLWARGAIARADVSTGVPEATRRHAPTDAAQEDPPSRRRS